MKQKLSNLWGKDGTKSVLASLISILIGMVVGALIIIIVGAANPSLGLNSAWEGIRLVFGGLFSTGRDAAGTLTFGFNSTNLGNMLFRATPLILTGLSVAGLQDRPVQHRRAGPVPDGHRRHPDSGTHHPH